MIQIDPESSVAINDQIKAGLRGLVARGLLRPGDEAPSIRSLAVRLRVNPNTVARAFRELTLEGFFEARRGEGNVIAEAALRNVKKGLGNLAGGLAEAVRLAHRGGLGWPDIEAVVKDVRREEP
ncbi:MAG: GntR family transcriptional regulator [Elusimicrobia bacterium]|nr:GntR family transcriptional regulator [Elusimicrobiota bacterium]